MGFSEGTSVGFLVGLSVGNLVGLGAFDGARVGSSEGAAVGLFEGSAVGFEFLIETVPYSPTSLLNSSLDPRFRPKGNVGKKVFIGGNGRFFLGPCNGLNDGLNVGSSDGESDTAERWASESILLLDSRLISVRGFRRVFDEDDRT